MTKTHLIVHVGHSHFEDRIPLKEAMMLLMAHGRRVSTVKQKEQA